MKEQFVKKSIFAASILLMTLPVRATIVFDGTNSYSSHEGFASSLKRIYQDVSDDAILLQERDNSQIDYTAFTLKNKSMISDPQGMRIEAEGFYRLKISNFDGENFGAIRPCRAGNGAKLARHRDSVFEYKIEVRTPGIYTFSIDAAGTKQRPKLELYGLQEGESLTERSEPLGTWIGLYGTGDWDTVVQNFGGPDKETPCSVDVELGWQITRLAFVMEYNFDIESIRVTRFTSTDSQQPESSKSAESADPAENGKTNEQPFPLRRVITLLISFITALSVILFVSICKKRLRIRKRLAEETQDAKKPSEW